MGRPGERRDCVGQSHVHGHHGDDRFYTWKKITKKNKNVSPVPIILNLNIFAKVFNLKKLKMHHIIKVVCYLLMCEFNLCSCLLFLFSGKLLLI